MKFIIKLHPEIAIKSKSVRKRFTKLLENNIRLGLKVVGTHFVVKNLWDKLIVSHPSDELVDEAIDTLQRIPGIVQFLQVTEYPFETVHDIYEVVHDAFKESLQNKSFWVKVKRHGNHDFTSVDVSRYVGGGLNQNVPGVKVQLKNPDEEINLEVKQDHFFLVSRKILGMGGFPLPTQDDVLSLISGGFDSGVATYLMMRKGSRSHFCFFNLGGAAHEIGVKQVSQYLWKRYSFTHRVKFITVDFEPVVAEILENIDNGYMGVILKRMMMRAAAAVADKLNIKAIVTGESIGQVSSQTITNLNVIDRVTPQLILRPLLHFDKHEIIQIAREIGTEDFAKTMPEYCGVISRSPTVAAKLEKVEAEEQKFDFSVLDRVLAAAPVRDIRDIETETREQVPEIALVSDIPEGTEIVDIRAPDEEDANPLTLESTPVHCIPFFKLATKFEELDSSKQYLLYCERGVMSKLQALLLHEQGHTNVKVYQPK